MVHLQGSRSGVLAVILDRLKGMDGEITAEKQRIRNAVRERRAELSEAQLQAARTGLTEQLISLTLAREADSVSCYLPFGTEPDTRDYLEWTREHGIDVLMPATREDGLLDWIRPSWEGTVTGAFGVPEPLGTILSPISVGEVSIMLVPAAGVDQEGVRLGWGRGYFDKNLGSMDRMPPVFAVIYDEEFVDELPRELHDVPVTGVVTPTRIEYLDGHV